jgi:hypothetical protein
MIDLAPHALYQIALCTPCNTIMLVSHTCILAIGHEKQGLEEPPEPAPVEAGNHEQDQVKPRCIEPQSLSLFYSSYILIMIIGCALSYRSWIDT